MVLECLGRGLTAEATSKSLRTSKASVHYAREALRRRFGPMSDAGMVSEARKHGWIE
jgi:hypothetical protein